jgi:hypothetical protein
MDPRMDPRMAMDPRMNPRMNTRTPAPSPYAHHPGLVNPSVHGSHIQDALEDLQDDEGDFEVVDHGEAAAFPIGQVPTPFPHEAHQLHGDMNSVPFPGSRKCNHEWHTKH